MYILWTFGIFYSHLEYIMAIWQFIGNLVYFPRFGKLHQERSGNPWPQRERPEGDFSHF
jgi:hypothetical protein